MIFWTIIRVALKSIAANKMRSFLTMLGVIIGVASVIAMQGLGAGTEEKVLESVRGMGANLLTVRAGQRAGGSGVFSGTQQNLKIEDAEAILHQVADVEMINPDVGGSFQAKFMSKNSRVRSAGAAATYFKVKNFTVDKGRQFTEAEVERGAKVCVMGPKTVTDLFGDAMSPVGETIKIKGINFLVVGVTKAKGDQGWFNPDDQLIIPYTTLMGQLLGQTYLDSISVQVKSGASMDTAQEKITEVLRRQHRLQANAPDDFNIRNLQEIQDSMSMVTGMFKMLLAGVAAVSLIVGGIGIMNIMLVTVTERTREIGIRKALGARNFDLMSQFLLEAVTVSVTGGMIGACIGMGSIVAFNIATAHFGAQFSAKLQVWPIVIAFGFSVLVGIFFGWYPARKAARLDPIEALRYE